ncbi:MAG: aryl-sulfate sulfotransferase [Candidatus Odinarchaeota archaeon]
MISYRPKLLNLAILFFLFSSLLATITHDSILPGTTLESFYSSEYDNLVPISDSPVKSRISDSWESIQSNIYQLGDFFDGYNAFLLASKPTNTVRFVITDMNGNRVRERILELDQSTFGHIAPINSTTLLLFASDYMVYLWNFYTDKLVSYPIYSHHDISYNPKTQTAITLLIDIVPINGTNYIYDTIAEVDATSNVIWFLNTSSFLPLPQPNSNRDYTHGNSVFWDIEDDCIYLNLRNLNTFYKIDRKTREVLWGLGELGDFELFDQWGNQQQYLFYAAHAVEKIDENTFIIFDNDYEYENSVLSRMLEITINETTMTANESWFWAAPVEYYSRLFGDADRLPNGNRLGAFFPSSRIVEVNESGQIVWEMNVPNTPSTSYSLYQAERFRLSPILSSPADMRILSDEDASTTWQVWYNFRTNHKVQGSYSLYLDDQLIETDLLLFNQFWRPVNLTTHLGKLENGYHNLTLFVADEGGHVTRDSVIIEVRDYYLFRDGPVSIESGQLVSNLVWYGDTISPLNCTIYRDGMLEYSFSWNGSPFSLDLNSMDIGIHEISFQLFNGSELVYDDNFMVTVHISAPPEVVSFPEIQQLIWGQTPTISWEIFDNSPANWTIIVDGIVKESSSWSLAHFQINWTVPVLDEGAYNVTLVLNDRLGYQMTKTIWLTILPPEYPVIVSTPLETVFTLQKDDPVLSWEVHGSTSWTLWKNGKLIRNGDVKSKLIEVQIVDWQLEDWRPGEHNLTLEVTNDSGKLASSTTWIEIKMDYGDAFANTLLAEDSIWFLAGENTIGPPDGQFTTIFPDYMDGFVTLDMGANEEIIDGNGDDFSVIAGGGEYMVWVGDDLDQYFEMLGTGTGNQSFDLLDRNLVKIRYVRIEYHNGMNVLLDAVVASNYNKFEKDTWKPEVTGPGSFWVWNNQSSVTITWLAFDDTPWSYSILVNGEVVKSSPWYGNDITFILPLPASGEVNVTLIIYDAFDNQTEDMVTIEVRPTRTTDLNAVALQLLVVLAFLAAYRWTHSKQ